MDIATLRKAVIALSIARLGEGEEPPGSNRGPLPDACFRHVHGANADPGAVSEADREWCAEFACYMDWLAGLRNGPNTASTGGIVAWARFHAHLGALPDSPSPGDIGCVYAPPDKPTPTGFCHTVRILGGPPDALRCIGGNERDAVRYSTRPLSSLRVVNPFILG